MGFQVANDSSRILDRSPEGLLAVCLSDGEAILENPTPLRPGSTYLLCFGMRFSRLVVRALVRYSHRMPGSPRRFEIGLTLPSRLDGERLAALSVSSPDPLPLLGFPRLVSEGEDAETPDPRRERLESSPA